MSYTFYTEVMFLREIEKEESKTPGIKTKA